MRHPTVFCHFQKTFSTTAFPFFLRKGHYQFVGSVCKQINKIYANENEDMKTTIWRNVAVSEELAEMCLHDHRKLG
jgi:hypothetical protein